MSASSTTTLNSAVENDPKASKTTDKSAPEELDKLPGSLDDDDVDIHTKLRQLRKDEIPALTQSGHNVRSILADDSYFRMIWTETGRYIRFVLTSWIHFFMTALFGGTSLFDLGSILFFTLGATVLLFFVLIFCLAAKFPLAVKLYYSWSAKYGGGLGLVNSGNPNLFKALTHKQAEAAKRQLSEPISACKDNAQLRHFSLDKAKFLLEIAAVIYEHENDGIRAAVGLAAQATPTNLQPVASASSVSLDPPSAPKTGLTQGFVPPGELVKKIFNSGTSHGVDNALNTMGDERIREFAASFGLDFEPVSELNSTSSQFCGLFWDPKSNWIVVAFKGTGPIEFGEWLTDFTTTLVDCGSYLPGFSRCHKGFKERIFPHDVSTMGGSTPYANIALAIKVLHKHLKKTLPKGAEINVWTTGHSLGCATATLAYSGFLFNPKDIGKKTVLRDAYLFAAPITVDRPSVGAFNIKMMADKKRPKTMWRITSNGDAVATCLPELGDYNNITVSKDNNFAFAHLGTEIKMRDHPKSSNVVGNHISYGATVKITSDFSKEEIAQMRAEHLAQPGEQKRENIGVMLQKIPIIGRFIAHCTVFYWDQLDRVALGECEWSTN